MKGGQFLTVSWRERKRRTINDINQISIHDTLFWNRIFIHSVWYCIVIERPNIFQRAFAYVCIVRECMPCSGDNQLQLCIYFLSFPCCGVLLWLKWRWKLTLLINVGYWAEWMHTCLLIPTFQLWKGKLDSWAHDYGINMTGLGWWDIISKRQCSCYMFIKNVWYSWIFRVFMRILYSWIRSNKPGKEGGFVNIWVG